MPAPQKLTDADVKLIRRRVRRGERISDLAVEFSVDRRTGRRRLDALEQAEAQDILRTAQRRLRRQAAAERERLPAPVDELRPVRRREQTYIDWLARPKGLKQPEIQRQESCAGSIPAASTFLAH